MRIAPISISTSGDTTVIESSAFGEGIFEILAIGLVTSADVNLTFKAGTTSLTGAMPLRELFLDRGQYPHFTVPAGKDFIINASAAVTVGGWVEYAIGGSV